jgi:single-strand DNA-binding protein
MRQSVKVVVRKLTRGSAHERCRALEVACVLNRIELIGRLTRDPELRYVSNGLPMAQFTLAVDRDFRNAAGDREADFVNCVTWRKLAELVGQYCAKGRLVAVEGRLQTHTYEAQDGSRRRTTEVVGDRVWFLDSPRGDTERPAEGATEEEQPDVLVEAAVASDAE